MRKIPSDFRTLFFSSKLSAINFSAYLSNLFIPQKTKPQALRVPPTGGTFSLTEQKIIWLLEMDKVPARYREGLIKYLNRYRSSILLYSIFSPRSFTFEMAERADGFYIKKQSWYPAAKEVENFIRQSNSRGGRIPQFSRRFSLKEKLAMRILWKFRNRFVKLEDLSSYIYGRKMPKNLHASETTLYELREKIKIITGRDKILKCKRNYGYQLDPDSWEDIVEF